MRRAAGCALSLFAGFALMWLAAHDSRQDSENISASALPSWSGGTDPQAKAEFIPPTTVPPPPEPAPAPAPAPRRAQTGRTPATSPQRRSTARSAPNPASGGGAGGKLAAIRACESGNDYGAVSANGVYKGAYQFDASTHRSVGGDGNAADDTPAQQDAAAARLMAQRGTQPWPVCGRR